MLQIVEEVIVLLKTGNQLLIILKMDLIQKASKLGYKHYTEFTIKELDKLPLNDKNKLIEYYFIKDYLRDTHKIHIEISPIGYGYKEFKWVYQVGIMSVDSVPNLSRRYEYSVLCKSQEDEIYYDTYEDALENGLEFALNNLFYYTLK